MSAEPITVRWLASADEIEEAFWQRCFPPPLEGVWWYRALETANLEDQFHFQYGLIEQRGEPVGIAPAFVMNVPIDLVAPPLVARVLRIAGRVIPWVLFQRTLFLGSPCADEGTVGLIAGVSLHEIADDLHRVARRRAEEMNAPMLVWKDFPKREAKEIAATVSHERPFIILSYPGTAIVLAPGGGLDGYLRSLSGSHRHQLKKKLKRGTATLPVETSIIREPGAAELAEVFALFMQTYERGETKFERLTQTFFENIARVEPARFILLRAKDDGRLVAFMLAFDMGKRAINKFIGLDYARAGESYLYFQLWDAFVRWAISIGATELQSGQTGYRAKLDVGHSLVPLFNSCRHRNGFLNRIFQMATRRVGWKDLDPDLKIYLQAHPEAGTISTLDSADPTL